MNMVLEICIIHVIGDVMKELEKLSKKMKLKKSYIVNRCLRQVLFKEYFETLNY